MCNRPKCYGVEFQGLSYQCNICPWFSECKFDQDNGRVNNGSSGD